MTQLSYHYKIFFLRASTDEVHLKQRTILWYLVFVGFSVNYMIRININIAIVDMLSSTNKVKSPSTTVKSSSSECFVRSSNSSTILSSNSATEEENKKFPSIERKILDSLEVSCLVLSSYQSHLSHGRVDKVQFAMKVN